MRAFLIFLEILRRLILKLLVVGTLLLAPYTGGAIVAVTFPIMFTLFFPKFYIKREWFSQKAVKVIAWLNLLTWTNPIFGFTNAFTSLTFAALLKEDRKLNVVLGLIGLTLNLAVVAWFAFELRELYEASQLE